MFIQDSSRCIQCGVCVDECHNGALSMVEDRVVHDDSKCNWCGHCLSLCPRDVIMIDGNGYSLDDAEDFTMLLKPTVNQIRRNIMMRRSVRQFNDEEVTEKELEGIIEAAKYAPTGMNRQGNMLLILQDEEEKKYVLEKCLDHLNQKADIVEANGREKLAAFFRGKYTQYTEEGTDTLFYNAPVVIYVFADTDVDGAICAATMGQIIQAEDLGFTYVRLAVDPFNEDQELREKYGIPDKKKCVIALIAGHTDLDFFSSVPRKDIKVIRK